MTQNSQRWFTLALLCATEFMVVLDFSIVNVALTSIQKDLGFSQQNLQWVISAYGLTFGGFLLLGGHAADLFGRRRVFMIGLGLFVLASLVGGLAQFEWVLISARAFQGFGAAILSPAALSILTTTFSEGSERNRALGIWGAMAAGGFGAGAILGGILTDGLSWRWVMFVNIPIGCAALVLTPMLLNKSHEQIITQKIDIAGGVTATFGLIAFVYALVEAPDVGWFAIPTLAGFGIALALLSLFIIIEWRSLTAGAVAPSPLDLGITSSAAPLLPLKIFRQRTLMAANVIGVLMNAAVVSMIFILTLYMQQVLQYSALQTGLAFLPHALAAIIAAPLASWLATRLGVKIPIIFGLLLLTLGLLLLAQIPVHGNFVWNLLPGTVIVGFGIVTCIVGVTIAATAGVRDSEQGLASGLLNTAQEVGAAIGLAILVAISTARTKVLLSVSDHSAVAMQTAITGGFQAALSVGAGFAAISIVVALAAIQQQQPNK